MTIRPAATARTRSGATGRRRRAITLGLAAVLAAVLAVPALAEIETSDDLDAEINEAVQVSQENFGDGEADGAVLTRADEVVDARAGSPLAEAVGGPMLLTDPDELDQVTADELSRAVGEDGTIHLLGGEAALSPAVEQAVSALGFEVERHGGATRFQTAEEVARAVAGLRDFSIENVDSRGHPDEVVVEVTRPPGLSGVDLPSTAWSLTENDEDRPVEIAETGVEDLEVMLVVDVPQAMGGEAVDAAREATIGFVNQLPGGANVGVVASSATHETELLQEPTDDHDAAVATLEDLEPGAALDLHNALEVSVEALAEAGVPAVLVLSDGSGTAVDRDGTLDLVGAAAATVHVVDLMLDEGESDGLAALAEAGGGQRVPAGDPAALAPLYDDLAYRLVATERLVYTSEAGRETNLTVTVDHDEVREQASTTVELPGAPRMITPGFWATDTAMLIGAGLLYVAMAVSILALLAPRPRGSQLAAARRHIDRGGDRTAVAGVADRLVAAADEMLRRRDRRGALNQALERAGLALRPGELIVLIGCAAVVAVAVGTLLVAWWLGAILAAATVLGAKVGLSYLAGRRQQRFIGQLSDTLQLLAGGLRSGYGLQQAIDAAAKEAESPTSEELARVVVEVRLGRDLMDALRAMADRMGSEDFDWVVQAIDIQREVGGDLAEVLDNVAATVRERARIRRQVKALSAEGRLSALVLFVLPFGVGAFILWTNPAYLATLTEELMGYVMIAVGAGLLIAGGLWLRKLVDLQY